LRETEPLPVVEIGGRLHYGGSTSGGGGGSNHRIGARSGSRSGSHHHHHHQVVDPAVVEVVRHVVGGMKIELFEELMEMMDV